MRFLRVFLMFSAHFYMLCAVSLHGAVPLRGVAVPSKQRLISNAVSLRGGITSIDYTML